MAWPFTKKKPTKKRVHHSASAAEVSTSSAASTRITTLFIILVYAGAAVVSAFGLFAIGLWFLPLEVAWAPVLMVDAGIIVYKLVEIKLRNDPRKMHLANKAKAGNIIATTVSSLGNMVHIVDIINPFENPAQFWGAFGFAGAAPWFAYLAGSVLVDVLVKPKPKKVDKAAVPEPVAVKKPAQRRRGRAKPATVSLSELMLSADDPGWTGTPQASVMPPPEARVGDGFTKRDPQTFVLDKPAPPVEPYDQWGGKDG